jgi:hypothetical protein
MFRFLCLLILSFRAEAADIGLSARALGMGNAHIAVVNNSDAIFYNPAGLAKMSGFQWAILDPGLATNSIDSYQDYLDIASDSSDVSQILNDLYGNQVTLYSGAKSLLSFGGFAFGAYGVVDANFAVNNPVYPNIETAYRVDFGFVAGTGFEVIPDLFHIGFQARRVSRQGGNVPIGVSTLATLNSEFIQNELSRSGIGYAFDWGATLTLPGSLKPTIAFTWRDMGDTSFEPTAADVIAPQPVQQEQIIGVGLNYESLLMDIRPAIDFRFLNRSDIQLGNKLNMGVELSWPVVDVRGGFQQGYLSYGVGFDLWAMRMDVASYGVELGEFPGQLEDRRYMVQVSFDFGIDPGSFSFFKLSRPSVKNHSRKQRR